MLSAHTNVAAAQNIMGSAGFEVTAAGAVLDDEDAIVGRVLRLVSEGFGVVLTTGGVGAEDKDRTIEDCSVVIRSWPQRFWPPTRWDMVGTSNRMIESLSARSNGHASSRCLVLRARL